MPDDSNFGYDPELGPGYFVQIRSDFCRSPAFTSVAVRLYIVLLSYAGEGVKAWPGQERLATECACTPNTVRRAVRELVDAELLTVRRRGQGNTNNYYLRKLPTLPPNSEAQKLRIKPEAQKLSNKKRSTSGTRSAAVTHKLHTEEEHTEKIEDISLAKAEPVFGTPEWLEYAAAQEERLRKMRRL